MTDLKTKILAGLRSPQFFAAVLILFFVEAAWIAVSAAYPMVFDENTHFGIIQLFSHQWSPLITQQPPDTEWAGALTRDPSYLYHYLLSFPYRLIAHITNDHMIQVIDLRFINILFFGGALILFRRLLLKTRVSPAIVHVTMLFFVLMPVVPLLAGQINYDNLLILVTAIALLQAVTITQKLRDGQLPIARLLALSIVCLLGSLVQYEFLVIFAGLFLWFSWQFWISSRRGLKIIPGLFAGWRNTVWQRKLLLAIPLIVASGLFAQKYGVNLAVYHTPLPACDQVMSREACDGYAPWHRNQQVLLNKPAGGVNANPLLYLASWTYRMLIAMFFTSSGGASAQAFYLSINPLPIIFGTALLVLAGGALLLLRYRQLVFRDYQHMDFLIFIGVFFTFMLWFHNYRDYVSLGEKVAIQGRYIFPVILPLMLIVALAFRQLFGHRAHLKLAMLSVAFLMFLQGGGALSYIVNSNESWYWQNSVVSKLNKSAQRVVGKLVVAKTPVRSFGTSQQR